MLTTSIVGGVLGWGAKKLGDAILAALTPSELDSRLLRSIRDWASGLPPERRIEYEAIFRGDDQTAGPACRLLSQRLIDSQLPTEEEWHSALIERWRRIVSESAKSTLQPFFQLAEVEASVELSALAKRLTAVCVTDERMYRSVTAGLDRRIREWQAGTPVLVVNEIEEPPNYGSNYCVHFHAHNSTSTSPLLISKLRGVVSEVRENHTSAPKTPGAPLNEYAFEVLLAPNVGSYEFNPIGRHRRFELVPGKTEFFKVNVIAGAGWDYLLRCHATAMDIRDGSKTDLRTAEFWLKFPC